MSAGSDPFNLDAIRVDIGTLARKARRRKRQFVMVPMAWVDRLGSARHAATLKVAHRLLLLHFRDHGRPAQLGNMALSGAGVSRQQKWRALMELERLGLVRVERRRNKSPIVAVIPDLE